MSEERNPNPSINFLVTKPIRFTSIYTTKWVYNLTIAYQLLLIDGVVIFLFATLIGGLGAADYPILIYATQQLEGHYFHSIANNAYFYFDNLSTLLIKSCILIVVQIFFLNSLFSFIGKLLKNHYASII